jgi:SsrA-binding protein
MKITNRKAFFDFEVLERFEAGINLIGAEVKAIKLGMADLTGSFVRIIGSETYLLNAKVLPYKYARPQDYDEKRTRKLLLHKREIVAIKSKMESSNLTLVPLSMYVKDGFIKLEVALGKGKKKYQKKESIKKKDLQREIEIELAEK